MIIGKLWNQLISWSGFLLILIQDFYKMMFQGPKGYIAQICEVNLQYENSTTKWPFYFFATKFHSNVYSILFAWSIGPICLQFWFRNSVEQKFCWKIDWFGGLRFQAKLWFSSWYNTKHADLCKKKKNNNGLSSLKFLEVKLFTFLF